jgi:hypothetical protein
MNDCQTLELEAKIDKTWDLAVANYRRAVKDDNAVYFMHYKNHCKRLARLMGEPATAIENEVQAWVEFVEVLN